MKALRAAWAAARDAWRETRRRQRLEAADRMIADTPELGGRYGMRGGAGTPPRFPPPAPTDSASSARPKVAPVDPSHLTDDPTDPRLGHGVGQCPEPQHDVYLVLSEEERAKGFVRPLRRKYVHVGIDGGEFNLKPPGCGVETTMSLALCETYARDPSFYGATYCVGCRTHRPVAEFIWDPDGSRVGS